MSSSNGTDTGSANGTNNELKDKRIRLSLEECKMIYTALKFYDKNSGESIQPYSLPRRFWALSTDEGFYTRRPRG